MAYLYPYGDTQQLNLDWLIEQWNDVRSQIDGSLQAEIDRVEAAITDLLTARNEAVAAQTAAQASAQAAAGSASTASGAASTATAQAQAAAGSAATAGAHASNAQGYAATAQQAAQAANNSASAAAVSEGNARNSETAAAGSSSAAAGNALYAEGYAKGTQNGNPVSSGSPYYQDNSKYYATQAGIDALAAEGWAIGEQNGTPVSSGSPYYENNAKYYAAQAPELIAPMFAGMTAENNMNVGEFCVVAGKLYVATQAIASGATLVPGTNVEQKIVADYMEMAAEDNAKVIELEKANYYYYKDEDSADANYFVYFEQANNTPLPKSVDFSIAHDKSTTSSNPDIGALISVRYTDNTTENILVNTSLFQQNKNTAHEMVLEYKLFVVEKTCVGSIALKVDGVITASTIINITKTKTINNFYAVGAYFFDGTNQRHMTSYGKLYCGKHDYNYNI